MPVEKDTVITLSFCWGYEIHQMQMICEVLSIKVGT
jgi:hypothetical protein